MSLTAKIEAVIYASEEPVTLPQLMSLLGVEAQAELDAQNALQEELQGSLLPLETAPEPEAELDEGSDTDGLDPEALNAETLGSFGQDEATSSTDEIAAPSVDPLASADVPLENHASPGETQAQAAPLATTDTSAGDAQAKRHARERERRLREYFRGLLDRLIADYAQGDRGLEIREVAGGFRFGTKPEFHDTVRGFVRSLKPPLKLSLQALETLAVVAYKQPVTAPEIGEIRGVDSGGVLGSLIARKLITTAGRKQVIGRPILYKTTKEFLLRFGLKDINELPSIEEFERMAGELNDAVQEEMEMEEAPVPRSSEEAATESSPLDELNATRRDSPSLHESVEDTLADKDSAPEATSTEVVPGQDPGAGEEDKREDIEAMRDVHENQADGTPDGTP